MSFDVFCVHFENGERAEADREPVLAVLHSAHFTGPDNFGFYVVYLDDGASLELGASKLEGQSTFTGCTFFLHELTEAVVAFIFDVARAGDMTMLATMPDAVPILVGEHQKVHLPLDLLDAFPGIAVCESQADLFVLLSQGHTDWKVYRDRVTRSTERPS